MKRYVLISFIVLLMPPAFADGPKGYPFVAFDQAVKQATAQGKPIFVYFGRYGCGYCEKTNKEAFSDAAVKAAYIHNYVLAYVDAESGKRLRLPSGERITERELGTRYKAFVTPVFSFITTEGDVLHRMIGVQRIEDLMQAHQKIQQLSKSKT